ncbi:MAG: BTAD domain-containing putative transcriptional regulator, partial [Oscillospiraceae bacterium]
MAENTNRAVVSITLLGGLSIEADGVTITDEINRSQKLWNILAYLIVHRERNVPQTELIEQFWPEESANPLSALKTLLCRLRAMLEPIFGTVDPILSQRGSYSWNRELLCRVDTDRFEELCNAGTSGVGDEERLERYREADELYRGDFLPKLSGEMWVIPLAAHYHSMYLKNVKAYAGLLEKKEQFETMSAAVSRAGELDRPDEELQILIVRALLRQGRDKAALAHYEAATELLYRSMGVRPSKELQELYTEIMSVEQGLETDLGVIQGDLREAANRPGAFVCEYGFFKEAYRLAVRRSVRSGAPVHIALITLSKPDGSLPSKNVLSASMDQLLTVLTESLRRGDVIAKYSGAQYVLMLPSANMENSTMVLERIVATFYGQNRRNFLKLSFKVHAVG